MTAEHAAEKAIAQNYKVTVHQNRIKRNQVTALHLMIGLLLFMMGFVTWSIPASIKTNRFAFLDVVGIIYSVLGISLILISIFFNRRIVQSASGNRVLRILEILILFSILLYTIIQKWYLPIAYSSAALLAIIFAFFWEKNADTDKIIQINTSGIIIPNFFRNQVLKWQDIDHVVLRHSVLTIDCRNNHLFQFDTGKASQEITCPETIEDFCKKMIEEHKSLPKNDW